jgi:hypothetical protein
MYSYLNKHGTLQKLPKFLNVLVSVQTRQLSEVSVSLKHGDFQKLLLYFNVVLVFEQTWRLSEASLSSNKLISEQIWRLSKGTLSLYSYLSKHLLNVWWLSESTDSSQYLEQAWK